MPKISQQRLLEYFTSSGQYYPLFKESVKLYDSLRVHADGEFPGKMITDRRPSETEEILKYRMDNYKPITKLPISKVITSFGKIRRSPDWCIDFPKETVSSKIIPEETLEAYCTSNMPGFVSITNWAFDILLKQNLVDANAVIAVIPLENIVTNKYTKPVPILFNSNQVFEFNEQEKYCILRSKRKINYLDLQQNFQTGEIFYYIDDKEIIIYQQDAKGWSPVFEQENITGEFPAFKIKAEAFKQFDNMSLSRSRLDAMVPFLDEAACEYSDLQGSKIQHLYPLMWFYQNRDCKTCKGLGRVTTGSAPTECKDCQGTGKVMFSPFAHIYVEAAGVGQQQVPMPPAGVVTRDTAILELQEKSVEANNFKALSAVNMQFLDQTPLSISGDAKNVDREELNNTVYNSAEDLIYSVDKVIYFINEWRYATVIPDKVSRTAMLPNIPVPQNFDLLPENYLMEEVSSARTAKVNPLLIATLEQQLAAKKFYNQPDLAGNIKLYFDLDPLPGLSVDEKMSLVSNKAITQMDFIISSYMPSFLKRAIREYKDFDKLEYDKQMAILTRYAQEKININDAAQQMIDQQKQKVLDELRQQGQVTGSNNTNQPIDDENAQA